MNFDLSDEQVVVRDLAARVFAEQATVERVREVERAGDGIDRALWAALVEAGLVGLAVPEAYGGGGLGVFELCLVLEQQGRHVAPVPLWPSAMLGGLAIAEWGTHEQRQAWLPAVATGEAVLTAALAEWGDNDPLRTSVSAGSGGRLSGTKPAVPAAQLATRVLVPANEPGGGLGIYLVDPRGTGASLRPVSTTMHDAQAHLDLDGAVGERLGGTAPDGHDVLAWIVERAMVGLCAIQVGVVDAAIRITADYVSSRQQFGRPLSTFQGVALQAADAAILAEAMRVTMWQAAWLLAQGRDATVESMVAKWWASEGGQRAVHITQHLHGGIGADVEYPVHRYFLWGKQIENTLGGASAQLARLGELLARRSVHS